MPTLTGLVPVVAKCMAVLLVSAALAFFTPAQRWRTAVASSGGTHGRRVPLRPVT
jgi:hypothetical protein